MNDLAKNLLLWVVVAAVLMVVFQSFSPKLAASQDVVYSQFVQDVQGNRVKQVDISSNERTVKFERTDGSGGTTTAPVRDRDLINDLIEHKVEIKQAPPDTGISFWSLVLNFLPVLPSARSKVMLRSLLEMSTFLMRSFCTSWTNCEYTTSWLAASFGEKLWKTTISTAATTTQSSRFLPKSFMRSSYLGCASLPCASA